VSVSFSGVVIAQGLRGLAQEKGGNCGKGFGICMKKY
jgi:hypothetical protein